MAYDEGLAERVRDLFRDDAEVEERKMFGGLCFMVTNHMCCGIVGELLMARVGADNYGKCLSLEHARHMDFTSRSMKGFIYVEPEGIIDDEDLHYWVNMCVEFVRSLPPKS